MTWYAYHLFAEASPPLLDKFLASPVMSKGVYWVRNLTDYPWHDSRVKHDLPSNGLLVVRPICSPSTHEAKWYGNQIISWLDIQGDGTIELNILPDWLQRDNPDYNLEAYPPQAFLKYLKQLSIDNKTTLAFYHCSMWGGSTDIEFAWVFENGNEIAYSGKEFRESPNTLKEYRQNGESIERKGDVLIDMLSSFSIKLSSPFFALHTRNFQWESFKMVSPQKSAG